MCAQYEIMAPRKAIVSGLKAKLAEEKLEWRERILPFSKAPVVVEEDGKRLIKLMQFSLLPAWSKERKVKFATHNARLFSFDEKKNQDIPIFEKPTWRSAFKSRHCLIPMTHFIEPIYSGSLAGHMVSFSDKSETLLVAAGLWESWVSKEDGEVIDSFTIITDDPISFVKKTGHDRSPLFLSDDAHAGWLDASSMEPKEMIEFLRDHKAKPTLQAEKDRALKAGWEKRK